MPFLENLILGKPGGGRRRRHAEDRSLAESGDGVARPGLGAFFSTLGIGQRRPGPDTVGGAVSDALGDHARSGGEPRLCGNLACGKSWTLPWKSREYPVFDGQWACSRSCLATMVKIALTREAGDGVYDDEPEPHRHRIPLGLVMLAQGWITHPQLQKALEAQRLHGSGRIGEWLVSECGMKPERIARGLGAQWNCPVLSIEGFWPMAMALALPRVFLEEYGVVPLRLAGRKILYVGFQDSLDASASFAIEQMTGLRAESGVMLEEEFTRARQILLRCEFPRQTIAAVGDRDGLARAIAETVEHEQPEASRLVRLHRYYWLRVWAKGGDCAAGDLPTNANGVRDYLFTIGSRVASSTQVDGIGPSIAEEERDKAVEEPTEFAAAAIGRRKAAMKEKRSANFSPDEWQDAAEEELPVETQGSGMEETVAKPTEVSVEALLEAKNAKAKNAEAKNTAEPARPLVATAAFEPSDDVEAERHVAEEETGAKQEELAARHFLARVEPWLDGIPSRDQHVAYPQTVMVSESTDLQRFMRRGFDSTAEPIDGEYLPVEGMGVESTVLVPESRSSSWNRFGLLRRLKPSFLDRETDPALDPGQEV